MNLLAGAQRSIGHRLPGTTRDVVEDVIRLEDVVLNLADTAGIRATDDPVESVGVDLARRRMEDSGLVLAVFDSSDPLTGEDQGTFGGAARPSGSGGSQQNRPSPQDSAGGNRPVDSPGGGGLCGQWGRDGCPFCRHPGGAVPSPDRWFRPHLGQ